MKEDESMKDKIKQLGKQGSAIRELFEYGKVSINNNEL